MAWYVLLRHVCIYLDYLSTLYSQEKLDARRAYLNKAKDWRDELASKRRDVGDWLKQAEDLHRADHTGTDYNSLPELIHQQQVRISPTAPLTVRKSLVNIWQSLK